MVQIAVINFAFGLVLAGMFWPGLAGAAEPSRWAFAAAAVPALLFFCRIEVKTIHWWLAALLGWAALSLSWTIVFYDGIYVWFETALMVGALIWATECGHPEAFYKGSAVGLGASSIIAIMQWFGSDIVIAQFPGAAPSGLFINQSMMGEAAAPIIMVLIARQEWRWVALVAPALALSQQRSSIIAVGICVLILMRNQSKIWIGLAVALSALAFFGVSYKILSPWPVLYPWASIPQRLDIWQDVLGNLRFFGHGIGSFYAGFPEYATHLMGEKTDRWIMVAHAHNDALEFLFELGIPGIAILGGIAFYVWRAALRTPEFYGLTACAITALVGFPLHMPYTGVVFAVMAGFALGNRDSICRTAFLGRQGLHYWSQRPDAGGFAESGRVIPLRPLLSAGSGAIGDQG